MIFRVFRGDPDFTVSLHTYKEAISYPRNKRVKLFLLYILLLRTYQKLVYHYLISKLEGSLNNSQFNWKVSRYTATNQNSITTTQIFDEQRSERLPDFMPVIQFIIENFSIKTAEFSIVGDLRYLKSRVLRTFLLFVQFACSRNINRGCNNAKWMIF